MVFYVAHELHQEIVEHTAAYIHVLSSILTYRIFRLYVSKFCVGWSFRLELFLSLVDYKYATKYGIQTLFS